MAPISDAGQPTWYVDDPARNTLQDISRAVTLTGATCRRKPTG